MAIVNLTVQEIARRDGVAVSTVVKRLNAQREDPSKVYYPNAFFRSHRWFIPVETSVLTEKMAVVSVANWAGGMGKTTLSVNLGYALHRMFGARVLLVDLDSSYHALTNFLGMGAETIPDENTIIPPIRDSGAILKPVKLEIGLDMIPSSPEVRRLEYQLPSMVGKDLRLGRALQSVQDKYDVCILDCPPKFADISSMALTASSYVLIPLLTQFKGLLGAKELLDKVPEIRSFTNPMLQIMAFVPMIYDASTNNDRLVLDQLRLDAGSRFDIWPPLPRMVAVTAASSQALPVALHAPASPAVAVFEDYAMRFGKHMGWQVNQIPV